MENSGSEKPGNKGSQGFILPGHNQKKFVNIYEDPNFREDLEKNANRFGNASCPICRGLGILFDPLGGGKARGAFYLCRCLESQKKTNEPPYEYYSEEKNSILPCPTKKARLAIEKMDRILLQSGIPEKYKNIFFFSINAGDLLIATAYAGDVVRDFPEKKTAGLYLHGQTGSGKTMLSTVVLNEIIRLYQTQVRYAKISRDIIGKLRASFNTNSEYYGEGRQIEEELAKVPVLVIDDFGVQKESPWVNSVLYDLIDARYENELLTILTSNEPLDSLKEISGGRVYSRLREMCLEIHIDAPDYRLSHAKSI